MLEQFRKRNIGIESRAVTALVGPGADLTHVQMDDGKRLDLDALYIGPQHYLTSSGIAEQIGCTLNHGPYGPSIAVDDMKMTSVPNVYAAGDITRRGGHTVTFASPDGVWPGWQFTAHWHLEISDGAQS